MNAHQERRRRSIVAERSAQRAVKERAWAEWGTERCWQQVYRVLSKAMVTETNLGHIDQTVDAYLALECAHELRSRGQQLELPV